MTEKMSTKEEGLLDTHFRAYRLAKELMGQKGSISEKTMRVLALYFSCLSEVLDVLDGDCGVARPEDTLVILNEKIVPLDAVTNLMDNDIREDLHSESDLFLKDDSPKWELEEGEQKFVDKYVKRHKEKFGENFTID